MSGWGARREAPVATPGSESCRRLELRCRMVFREGSFRGAPRFKSWEHAWQVSCCMRRLRHNAKSTTDMVLRSAAASTPAAAAAAQAGIKPRPYWPRELLVGGGHHHQTMTHRRCNNNNSSNEKLTPPVLCQQQTGQRVGLRRPSIILSVGLVWEVIIFRILLIRITVASWFTAGRRWDCCCAEAAALLALLLAPR